MCANLRAACGAKRSRLPMTAVSSTQQAEGVRQRLPEYGVPVSAPTWRAGQVDDEGTASDTGHSAREQAVGRPARSVGSKGLGNPRNLTLEDRGRRFRSHVSRRDPGSSGRQDHAGLFSELLDRFRDLASVIWNDPPNDLVSVLRQELLEESAAFVVSLAARDPVGDGQHGRIHAGSLLFSRSRTSDSVIVSSTALAMS